MKLGSMFVVQSSLQSAKSNTLYVPKQVCLFIILEVLYFHFITVYIFLSGICGIKGLPFKYYLSIPNERVLSDFQNSLLIQILSGLQIMDGRFLQYSAFD